MDAPSALASLPAEVLALAVARLPLGILLIGADDRITFANVAATEVTGLAVEQLVGINLRTPAVAALEPLARHYRDDGPFTAAVEWQCQCPGPASTTVWRGGWFVPLAGAATGPPQIMCIIQDTTAAVTRERELIEQRHRLRAVIDAVPDPLFMLDPAGRYVVANQATAERFHTTPSTLIGRRDVELGMAPARAAATLDRVAEALTRNQLGVALETRPDIGDQLAYVRSLVRPVESDDGNRRVVVLDQDITSIMRSQLDLAESEQRLRNVLAVIQEAVWDWNVVTDRIKYSAQLRAMLGYDDDTPLERIDDVVGFVHIDDRPEVERRMRALATGAAERYESEHRLVGPGGVVWVRDRGGVVERAADGRPVRVVGSTADITLRRAAEVALRRLLAEKEAIVQSETVGFVIERDNEILWMNPAAAKMFGYEPGELVGRSVAALLPPDAAMPPFAGRAVPVIAAGGVFRAQRDFRRKDGSIAWFDVSGARLHAATGENIWAAIDITALKESERALIEARQAAEASNQAKGRFLAMMSHGVRTPLNGILGMAQILVDEDLPPERVKSKARTIVASGEQLLSILNDVLDLSSIEDGRLTLRAVPFSPAQVIAEILALHAPTAGRKRLELSGRWMGPDQASYLGDAGRLRQVIGNLISNAIKFTDRGRITVEAREYRQVGEQVVVEVAVADTGLGISAADRARLFTRFSQLDDSSTRRHGGTGLGLAIVKELVEAMSGSVDVDSTEGVGSRFWVRVPLPRAVTAARTTGPLPTLSGTILVVEDHEVNRRVIELMLRRLGADVRVAEDGRAGVDAATATPRPDLVLMDIQMPELDGHDATRAIRAWEVQRGAPRVPIVAITANAFDDDRAAAAAAGMDDFMAKPINAAALGSLVARWLARPAS
ncbi:MAG: PAS domain S-box protein [Kofleriaceae bacterium]